MFLLKCVFPVSIWKELPELTALFIIEANELEEIFKSEGEEIQKVKIPNLKVVAIVVHLPNLCHTQGIQLQTVDYRFVQNCPNLSLTSAFTPFEIIFIIFDLDFSLLSGYYNNEDPSANTTKDLAFRVEVETTSEHKLTSSQIKMKQKLEPEHEFVEHVSDLELPLVAILPTNSKVLLNEELAESTMYDEPTTSTWRN